jgi:DNA end-binding protein Ku
MARAIWSGAISFGLVTVPVRLYTATESHTVSFTQFQKGTGERIRNKRVAEGTGEEVEYRDIVKGAEVAKGQFVIVTPEELEAIEPGRSRTIDILDFVDLEDIDPITWNKTYYLGPAEDVGAEKPYRLLLEAMRSTGKVAIANFVMRGKQYLATIRPLGDLLALETMFFADEIRGADEVENAPVDVTVDDREVGMAEQLIASLSTEWEPSKYRDTYRERVEELIEAKAKGEEVVTTEPEEAPEVGDLMEALRASVEASKQRRRGGAAAMAGRSGRGESDQGESDQGESDRGDGDLGSLSKDELYERASNADIAGRSKMTKDELLEALRSRTAS